MKNIVLAVFAGLLFLCFQSGGAVAANLVSNGGFETGDLSGWTLTGNDDGNTFVAPKDVLPVHSGDYALALGAVGADINVSQSIAAVAGQSYYVGFRLNSDGEIPNHFAVSLGGFTLFDQLDIGVTNGYTYHEYKVVANSNNPTLTFTSRNDPSYLLLDDVSVDTKPSSVPLPAAAWFLASGLLALVGIRKKLNI